VHQCDMALTPNSIVMCQAAAAALQPTPSAVHQCGGQVPVGTQFTNYFGCTAACAAMQANAPPPSGTMHQCCGVQAGGGFPTLQACLPVTANCMTIPARCGVFTPFGTQ
jgi:hypothetical protein